VSPSQECLDFLKKWEGCRLEAYPDIGDVYTIGYGYTGPEVIPGLVWSQSQANMALVSRCNAISSILGGCVRPILSQNQWDALIALCYNIGQGAFRGSSLLRAINQREWDIVPELWKQWNHVKGIVDKGLTNRRKAEIALWETIL
jgi:lysozyme